MPQRHPADSRRRPCAPPRPSLIVAHRRRFSGGDGRLGAMAQGRFRLLCQRLTVRQV